MDRCAGRRQHLRGDRAAWAAQLHGQHRDRYQPSALQHQPAHSVLQQLGGAGRPAPDAAARARRHGRQLPFPPGGLAAALRLPARPRAHHVRDAQNPAAPREGDPDWDGPHWRIQLSLCEPHHLPLLCDFGCGLTAPHNGRCWWQTASCKVVARRTTPGGRSTRAASRSRTGLPPSAAGAPAPRTHPAATSPQSSSPTTTKSWPRSRITWCGSRWSTSLRQCPRSSTQAPRRTSTRPMSRRLRRRWARAACGTWASTRSRLAGRGTCWCLQWLAPRRALWPGIQAASRSKVPRL